MIIQGDCQEKLKELPSNSIDSIVTDPPYGISFMGKKWDYDVPKVEVWQECLRVLKPGGHALVACGTRTQHRMVVNLEDAGFEIRDIVAWVYGSGFPKSLNIGKAVDKLQGNERVPYERPEFVARSNKTEQRDSQVPSGEKGKYTKGNSPYEGWGTALKPALELWTLCRKPLSEKTIAKNVLKWGTGGINIDGCRVGTTDKYSYPNGAGGNSFSVGEKPDGKRTKPVESNTLGRFPANFIHDGSDEVVGLFPNAGRGNGGKPYSYAGKEYNNKDTSMFNGDKPQAPSNFNDSGSASRFFYCAKASKSERNRGLEKNNGHPTIKPVKLMEYLVRLITPKEGTVLDPFMGSGTTGMACKSEGFDFIGIELNEDYCKIAEARIKAVSERLI